MSKRVKLENIDAAFALASKVKGDRITFQIYLAGAATASLSELFAARLEHASLVIRGEMLIITFDHCICDGLGAVRKIHEAISGLRVESPQVIAGECTLGRRKSVRRRSLTRLVGRMRTALPGTDFESHDHLHTLLFLVEAVTAGTGSLTERTVRAVHEALLTGEGSPREYTSILVPVTVWPWEPRRPAANLSSGFISVATIRELRSGELDRKVKDHFKAGRGSRTELLRRTSQFGRLPRCLWGPASFLAKRCAGLGESAVVSNMGTILDPTLESLGCTWFFVPSIRNEYSLAVGLVRVGDMLTVTVSGQATSASLRVVSMRVFALAGIVARELRYEPEDG